MIYNAHMYTDQYGDEWPSEAIFLKFSQRKTKKKKKKTEKQLPGRHRYGIPRGTKPKCSACNARDAVTTSHVGDYVCQQCFLEGIAK